MAIRLCSTLILAGFIGLAPTDSFADDGDIDFELDEDEDEDEEPPPKRLEEADAEDLDEGDPDDDEDPVIAPKSKSEDPLEKGSGLLNPDDDDDEEDDGAPLGQLAPGEDNATLYRAKLSEVEGLSADEESMAWEEYLTKYPKSSFRKTIQERQDQLSDSLYGGGLDGPKVDAGKAELNFAQGLLIEPIDPQTRLRAGFAWGFPNWVNLLIDYEKQLHRDLSVHGGAQRRTTGWNVEGGVRYAIIKDTRTDFILSAIGDVHMVLNPTVPALRPQLAVGKRFAMGSGHWDLQGQLGPDLMLYAAEFSPRLAGGINITIAPSDTVEAFIETHTYMKDTAWEEGNSFRFNQIAFGMRFLGKKNPSTGNYYSAGAGAAVPYSVSYWKYHYGAVMGDFNYYQ